MTSEAPWFQKWTIRVTPKKFGSNISVYKLFSADQQTVSWPPRYSAKHRLGSVANHTKFHSITRFPQRNQQDTNNEEIHTVADTQIKLVSGRRLVFLCLMNGTCLKDWLPYASLYCPLFATWDLQFVMDWQVDDVHTQVVCCQKWKMSVLRGNRSLSQGVMFMNMMVCCQRAKAQVLMVTLNLDFLRG